MKAFEAMVQTGELACNAKFMIEGEEEVGSVHLGTFIEEYKEFLKAFEIEYDERFIFKPIDY